MADEYEVSFERVDDINAENWEQLADSLPPSMQTEAEQYRQIAKKYRDSKDEKMVRVFRPRSSSPR